MRPDPSAFVEGKGGGFQHKSKVCVFKSDVTYSLFFQWTLGPLAHSQITKFIQLKTVAGALIKTGGLVSYSLIYVIC